MMAWSYSRWSTYDRCPAQYWFKHIKKLPEEKSAAMQEGLAMHKGIAAHITNGLALPEGIHKDTVKMIGEIKEQPDTVVEQQWAFRQDWSQTTWFAKDVWLRAVLDVGVLYSDMTAVAVDWKNKLHGDYDDQMDLFALVTFKYLPAISHVTTWLQSYQTGESRLAEYEASDVPDLEAQWTIRASLLASETEWKAKPGSYCRWCAFSKAKGGPCVYG